MILLLQKEMSHVTLSGAVSLKQGDNMDISIKEYLKRISNLTARVPCESDELRRQLMWDLKSIAVRGGRNHSILLEDVVPEFCPSKKDVLIYDENLGEEGERKNPMWLNPTFESYLGTIVEVPVRFRMKKNSYPLSREEQEITRVRLTGLSDDTFKIITEWFGEENVSLEGVRLCHVTKREACFSTELCMNVSW